MSTILHLSDLHLGDPDAWERETDDKAGLVPQDENTRLSVLQTSLGAVTRHLAANGESLDAVVVSGDLTSANDPQGFERCRDLFSEVGIAESSVVVVPGNHDVDWSSDPDTPGKYASFLEHTRHRGMRTPFCDGVDTTTDPDGSGADPILSLDDCLVIAINSANWCGTRLGVGRGRRTVDVARVSERQLDHLTDELRELGSPEQVRIAVLHHHLLPVTEDEEVKPFESFTNLARLRAWLRIHRFHAVLHGHKHRPTLTWDHVHDFERYDAAARRILMVSAPTPTTWGAPICRLIRIGESAGRRVVAQAPRVVVETVKAARHEHPVDAEQVAIALDPGPVEPPGSVSIDALTADAAYERLLHELEAAPGKLFNVTCVVRDAASAEDLPTNFTRKLDVPADWLEQTVAWWQEPAPALVAAGEAAFNHGERLYSPGGGAGALQVAAARLGSTKAMVLLVRDQELRLGHDMPAFVAVQLVRATDATGDRLDCVGYFRKQDLSLWWPVNIRELREIQKRVLELPAAKRLRAGRLVTIAVEAIQDDVLPQLAGTRVDRAVDLRPELLMEMAYRVAHANPDEHDEVLKLWTDVLRDIGGAGEAGTSDFPSLGIERLLEHLRVFRNVGKKDHLGFLIRRLEGVYDRAQRAKRESMTTSDRARHSHDLFEQVGEVLDAVSEAVRTNPTTDG